MPHPQPDLELPPSQADRLATAWLGADATCTGVHRLTGGLVNSVFRLDVDQPPWRAVVKLHDPGTDSFAQEARALRHLRTQTGCPVPAVLVHDDSAQTVPHAFLLLEHVPGVCLDGLDLADEERADVDRQLADLLADLHTHTATTWGGLSTPEHTGPWADLVVRRLRDVRARPTITQRLTPDVLRLVDQAIRRVPAVLDDGAVPTLIHGDVWDGNVMVERRDGRWRITGLLDPTADYADVEQELAYLEAFDTPRPAFFAAYTRHHDLRPGYEQRRLVHWLHTALVHVALFELEVFHAFTARTAAAIVRPG